MLFARTAIGCALVLTPNRVKAMRAVKERSQCAKCVITRQAFLGCSVPMGSRVSRGHEAIHFRIDR